MPNRIRVSSTNLDVFGLRCDDLGEIADELSAQCITTLPEFHGTRPIIFFLESRRSTIPELQSRFALPFRAEHFRITNATHYAHPEYHLPFLWDSMLLNRTGQPP